MIQQKLRNKLSKGLLKDPYIFINIFLAGVILLVIAYSGIFSPVKNNYPVVCIHEKLTGIPCASCGLSHSFSLILRGRISEALQWNVYGLRVFLFFTAQLLLRVSYTRYYISFPENRKQLILTDSIGSSILFLLAFWPYMRWIAVQLVN